MTKTGWITWMGFLLPFFLFVSICSADEKGKWFIEGIKYYQEGDFDNALKSFRKIADQGVRNPNLFYNLGNAYLKKGDTGHAMLWYERALSLNSGDPDLKFNYDYARSLVKDAGEDKYEPLYRIIFFWKHMLSKRAIQWIGIFCNVLFWMILSVRLIRRKKKVLNTASILILAASLIFISTACYDFYQARYVKYAVIIPEKASIRSGLSENSTELFILHAGSKVRIREEHGDFFKIFFSEGKIGWIPKQDAEII